MTDDDGPEIHGEQRARLLDGEMGTSTSGRHLVTTAEDLAGRRAITETGRFQRAVRWAMSWKGALAFVLGLVASAACWAAKVAVDQRVAVGVAPVAGDVKAIRADLAAVKEAIAGIEGSLRVLIPAAATRPCLPPIFTATPPPPAPATK